MTTRRWVLVDSADAFHSWALLKKGFVCNGLLATQAGRRDCIARLYAFYRQAHQFMSDSASVPTSWENVPSEAYERPTVDEIWQQYQRLQNLTAEVESNAWCGQLGTFGSRAAELQYTR